jgi:hypothetical protein
MLLLTSGGTMPASFDYETAMRRCIACFGNGAQQPNTPDDTRGHSWDGFHHAVTVFRALAAAAGTSLDELRVDLTGLGDAITDAANFLVSTCLHTMLSTGTARVVEFLERGFGISNTAARALCRPPTDDERVQARKGLPADALARTVHGLGIDDVIALHDATVTTTRRRKAAKARAGAGAAAGATIDTEAAKHAALSAGLKLRYLQCISHPLTATGSRRRQRCPALTPRVGHTAWHLHVGASVATGLLKRAGLAYRPDTDAPAERVAALFNHASAKIIDLIARRGSLPSSLSTNSVAVCWHYKRLVPVPVKEQPVGAPLVHAANVNMKTMAGLRAPPGAAADNSKPWLKASHDEARFLSGQCGAYALDAVPRADSTAPGWSGPSTYVDPGLLLAVATSEGLAVSTETLLRAYAPPETPRRPCARRERGDAQLAEAAAEA